MSTWYNPHSPRTVAKKKRKVFSAPNRVLHYPINYFAVVHFIQINTRSTISACLTQLFFAGKPLSVPGSNFLLSLWHQFIAKLKYQNCRLLSSSSYYRVYLMRKAKSWKMLNLYDPYSPNNVQLHHNCRCKLNPDSGQLSYLCAFLTVSQHILNTPQQFFWI